MFKFLGLQIATKRDLKKMEEERSCCRYASGLPFYGQRIVDSSPLCISAVYRATQLISDNIAILPLQLKRDTDKGSEIVKDHPLSIVLAGKYDTNITMYQLKKLIVSSVILRGNAFVYVERKNNVVTGLRYIESDRVSIYYNAYKPEEMYYTCNLVDNGRKIEPVNMLHFRLHTFDGIHGVSVIHYAARTLNIANQTEQSAEEFFESGMNLSGVITVQGQLSDNQRHQIRNSWNEAYGGGNRGLAVLQGNMSYSPISINPADAQLLESRKWNIEDIARFMGVHPWLLGDTSTSAVGSVEQIQQDFLLHTLYSYIVMIEEEMTRKLLTPSESDMRIDIDESFILRTSKAEAADYYTKLQGAGIMTTNEVRRELGLQDIEGGDKAIIPYTDVAQNTVGGDTEDNTEDSEQLTENEQDNTENNETIQ